MSAPGTGGSLRELNTQAGCLYGQGRGRLAVGPTTWRSIHSYVADPMASAPTSRMKVG